MLKRKKYKAHVSFSARKRNKSIGRNALMKVAPPYARTQSEETIHSIDKMPVIHNRLRLIGYEKFVSSMNLDEMLEASNAIDAGFRGEKLPRILSNKARMYTLETLRLNKDSVSKKIAQNMQQNLTDQIIGKNKRTTDTARAEQLYKAIMKTD